ncbi:MAG: hypothetical protein COA78_31660 [Blastopirellula sp.]|nr:MAG: hypothetical protein COA78_31660 [Blastopirellula sp.]
MTRFIQFVLIAFVLILSTFTSTTSAASPSYLILQPPRATSGAYQAGRRYSVRTSSYSYGWFGATSTTKWSRHKAYYGNYVQWRTR